MGSGKLKNMTIAGNASERGKKTWLNDRADWFKSESFAREKLRT